jgi:hypothetical protein
MGKILISLWASFSGLGIYRGVKEYNYLHKKSLERHEESLKKYPNYTKQSDKPKYYTTSATASGFLGFLFYATPIILPIMVSRELYRLEINLRGYDDEKEKDDYYKLI